MKGFDVCVLEEVSSKLASSERLCMCLRFFLIFSLTVVLSSFAYGCAANRAPESDVASSDVAPSDAAPIEAVPGDAVQGKEDDVYTEESYIQEALLISGVIEKNGKVGRLSPAYRVQAPVIEGEGEGAYSVELVDAGGETLRIYYFDPIPVIAQDETPQPGSDTFGFSFNLPAVEGVKAIRLKRGAEVLHELSPGPKAPQIQGLSASGLDQTAAGQTLKLTWSASDPDGDKIYYLVRYSPDGGQTWRTIGVNLVQSTLSWDLSKLGETQQGLIQVLASDGVNTRKAILGPFAIGWKGPSVSIIRPTEGTVVKAGYPLILLGSGQDPEDGTLPDERLVWTSDISGVLGTGQTVQLDEGLPLGTHVITLTAEDSNGNQASQSVTIQVQ